MTVSLYDLYMLYHIKCNTRVNTFFGMPGSEHDYHGYLLYTDFSMLNVFDTIAFYYMIMT